MAKKRRRKKKKSARKKLILFVFEGSNREPYVYKTIERLYFPKKNDNIICSFGNNIYDLYSEMMKYGGDGDIVSIMRERLSESGDSTLHNIRSTDISEVYLFLLLTFFFPFGGSSPHIKVYSPCVALLVAFALQLLAKLFKIPPRRLAIFP